MAGCRLVNLVELVVGRSGLAGGLGGGISGDVTCEEGEVLHDLASLSVGENELGQSLKVLSGFGSITLEVLLAHRRVNAVGRVDLAVVSDLGGVEEVLKQLVGILDLDNLSSSLDDRLEVANELLTFARELLGVDRRVVQDVLEVLVNLCSRSLVRPM